MTPTEVKLKIAIDALLEIRDYHPETADDAADMRRIAVDALFEIQRDHHLGEPSPVVHEVLAGVKL
jgi:hypothetical protein